MDINKISWETLQNNNLWSINESNVVFKDYKKNPNADFEEMRSILEKICKNVHVLCIGPYFQMDFKDIIFSLYQNKIITEMCKVFLNTIRLAGNTATHVHSITIEECEPLIPMFYECLLWLITIIDPNSKSNVILDEICKNKSNEWNQIYIHIKNL